MANKLEKGCTFGLVLQNRVNNMENLTKDGFNRMDKSLDEIKEENKKMFNHMSDRPSKQSSRQINILTGLCAGLGGAVVSLIGILIYGARLG